MARVVFRVTFLDNVWGGGVSDTTDESERRKRVENKLRTFCYMSDKFPKVFSLQIGIFVEIGSSKPPPLPRDWQDD